MNQCNDLEEIRREQIIAAALRKIAEVGIYTVTLEEIAKEAGFSKGGIAHYFSTKETLCKEAFKSFFEGIFKRSRDTMGMYGDPREKILSFGWLYDRTDPDVNMGYQLLFDFTSMSVRDEECRKIYHDWVDNWIVLLKEAISDGVKQGIFRDMDAEFMARSISAIYHGIAMRWYLDRSSHPAEWAVKAFTESITRLLGV
ncbi:MAG TPA: TetR/AcrR family transcriptional regulator [Spirochaetota bacterium]|nr:TetR/AcrR family transcriptional regulator [Spirochaetota bacterium]